LTPSTPLLAVFLLAGTALSSTFNVNSTADILAPSPGVVTLRSAIQSANATPGGNTINLAVAGIYEIALPGANTGTNSSGAFAILPGGGDLTIANTSGATVVVDGQQLDRVFDINPTFNPASPSSPFTVTMRDFTITNGLAQPGDGAPGSGGGIRAQGNVSLTLLHMTVAGNEATADGGGIAVENVVSEPWTLTVGDSTVANNHAGDAGGGLDTDGSGTVAIEAGTLIAGNTAVNQGGGIWLDPIQLGTVFQTANLNVEGAAVTGNKALGTGSFGGGIGNGGNGTVNIADTTVQNNFSGNVGGGFADENAQETLVVSRSSFSGNTASSDGGAIWGCGPSLAITFTEIDGNSCGGSGGAVFACGTTLTIGNSTLASNTVNGSGGGIELQTTGIGGAASTITNCTIAGNSAPNNAGSVGGGIDASSPFAGSVNLTGDTISGNFAADGGGVFWAGAFGSAIVIVDTIIATNAASSAGPDANNPASTFTDNGGNLIGISGAGSGNSGFTAASTQSGTPANPLDPLLGPLQNNGGPTQTQALLAGSPAIDRGVATPLLSTDQRGVIRPQGPRFDVGAYEVNQGPTPVGTLSATTLNFGDRRLGAKASHAITIKDTGTAPLALSNVAIVGANAGDFLLTPSRSCAPLPVTINPRRGCRYKVTFAPSAVGLRTGALVFTDDTLNAPNSEELLGLTGMGIK
jgi:hypothetical protein